MVKRRKRKRGLHRAIADVISMVSSAREASKAALRELRNEIAAAKRQLEKLVAEERSFRMDLFTTDGSANRTRAAKSRNRGRPGPRKAVARRAKPRRKGPAKADAFLENLPAKFNIEDVRKVAGRAAPISLAQWARARKIKKTAAGYQKVA
jgi:hypothetical protein